jgi:putative flippase GtrA
MHTIYNFLVTIPDIFYPWGGQIAYNAKILSCKQIYGYAFDCKDLFFYREFFHLVGAFFVFGIYLLIERLSNRKISKYFAIIFTLYLLFQELYFQQKFEGQMLWKAFSDLFMWLVPFWLAIFIQKIHKYPKIKERYSKLITFVHTNIASLIATTVDYIILIVSYKLFHLELQSATILGVVLGGLTFFLLAHSWVFDPTGRSIRSEGWRFFFVWAISLILNVIGTILLARLPIPYFIARILGSILVFIFWNYPMNKFWAFAKNTKAKIL